MKKIVFIIGSGRKNSFNKTLSQVAAKALEGKAEIEVVDVLDVPLLNQDEDEHHDVDAVDRAAHHRQGDLIETLALGRKLGVGARNGNRLGDGAVDEFADLDGHAGGLGVGLKGLLGGFQHLGGAVRLGDHELAAIGHIRQFCIFACRNAPRGDDGQNRDDEQNSECGRDVELLLFLLRGRRGRRSSSCFGHTYPPELCGLWNRGGSPFPGRRKLEAASPGPHASCADPAKAWNRRKVAAPAHRSRLTPNGRPGT